MQSNRKSNDTIHLFGEISDTDGVLGVWRNGGIHGDSAEALSYQEGYDTELLDNLLTYLSNRDVVPIYIDSNQLILSTKLWRVPQVLNDIHHVLVSYQVGISWFTDSPTA